MPRVAGRMREVVRERGTRCCDVTPGVGEMDWAALERLSTDLELLAHPVRLQILGILVQRGGEVCVCDLERALPVKQPTVSHHLRLLREAGWIETVRKGIWAFYFVRPEVVQALRQRVGRLLSALG